MKRLLLVLLILGVCFACSDEEFNISEPNIAEEDKTATVVLNNIPQDLRGDSVYVFTKNNDDEFYSATSASAIEDSQIATAVPAGNASFTIIAYIPTVSEWNIENAFDKGFYSTITGATDRTGRYITNAWQEADSYDDSNKGGASDILSVDLSINGETEPANNSYAQGDIIVLSGAVTNNLTAAISSVTFEVDGQTIQETSEAPYSINFNTVDLDAGEHVISVTARNEDGDEVSDEIEIVITTTANSAPTVNISGLTNGSSYERQSVITINSNVGDDDGIDDIARVEFIINGTTVRTVSEAPFTYEWDTYDNSVGSVTVEVAAYDEAGATRSDFVNVNLTAPENYAPRVNLTSPSNNSNVAVGSTITVSANASDDENDPINRVEFRILNENGAVVRNVGTVNEEPYSVQDYDPMLGVGSYIIEAEVYDDLGNSSTDTRNINIVE